METRICFKSEKCKKPLSDSPAAFPEYNPVKFVKFICGPDEMPAPPATVVSC